MQIIVLNHRQSVFLKDSCNPREKEQIHENSLLTLAAMCYLERIRCRSLSVGTSESFLVADGSRETKDLKNVFCSSAE